MDLSYHPDIYVICQFVQYLAINYPELKDNVVIENGEISFNSVPRSLALEVLEKFKQLKVTGVSLSIINLDGSIAAEDKK